MTTAIEDRFDQSLPAQPESVGALRRGVTDFVRRAGAEELVAIDVSLAVSEAATNAVLHAFVDREPGILRVVVELREDVVEVVVRDDGRGMIPRSDSPGIGLGLPTIGQLTARFDIGDGPGGAGTEVRMLFDAPGVRAPMVAEDWRLEVLADVARVTGSAWPGDGVERLVDLLVPRIADACTVDVLQDGEPQRVAAGAGDVPAATVAWLRGRRPVAAAVRSVVPELSRGQIAILPLDPSTNARYAAGDDDLPHMEALGLRWWVSVPLRDGETLLGVLGLGLRPVRSEPAEEHAFLAALGERAARGLAGAQLVEELRRTRTRLERVFAALSEAVTVADRSGRILYANDAALQLLGAASVEEVLAASPGELSDRFDITDGEGRPVSFEELPAARLFAGEERPTLLSRSVHKATGRARWLLTRATRLDDESAELLAVSVIEDVTELERLRRLAAEHGLSVED